MSRYLALFIQPLVALALAPALVGFIRWLKARLQGRQGAPIWQPYFEIRKLFGKEAVVSHTASWLFRATPFVVFGTSVLVASLVPLVIVPAGPLVVGDLFAAVYLLLLGTFFLALAGLDTGSPFGGMGASREMTVVALTEPTVALSIVALALNAGSTSFSQIVTRTIANPAAALGPGHLLAFAALFVVMLAETGRLPVDNPSTHLELTMIHEAMVLEYSGPYLALIEWGATLKLLIFLVLAANLFVPWGIALSLSPLALLIGLVSLIVKLAVLSAAVAVLETRVAKLRLFRVPELLSVSFVLALLAVISAFLGEVSIMNGTFSQLVMLGSSAMLLTALSVLWRKGVPAYITAYRWQSWILTALTAAVAYYGGDPQLYWVAALLLVLKGVAIPALLRTMQRRFGAQREATPYVNTETSLVIASLLVLFAYVLASPWMSVSSLPTRQGLPLAMGLLFVSLFIVVSRKKAITQVIGFLMLENAIALLAAVEMYGVPLLVELGVFLDALMGFLVMQIFVYHIHETFDTIDVEELARLRH